MFIIVSRFSYSTHVYELTHVPISPRLSQLPERVVVLDHYLCCFQPIRDQNDHGRGMSLTEGGPGEKPTAVLSQARFQRDRTSGRRPLRNLRNEMGDEATVTCSCTLHLGCKALYRLGLGPQSKVELYCEKKKSDISEQ